MTTPKIPVAGDLVWRMQGKAAVIPTEVGQVMKRVAVYRHPAIAFVPFTVFTVLARIRPSGRGYRKQRLESIDVVRLRERWYVVQ
jgi:hypothetical protein